MTNREILKEIFDNYFDDDKIRKISIKLEEQNEVAPRIIHHALPIVENKITSKQITLELLFIGCSLRYLFDDDDDKIATGFKIVNCIRTKKTKNGIIYKNVDIGIVPIKEI